MYRILLLLTLACTFVFPTRAQYVRVNYDKKTVAAMVAAYGTETVAEAYYNEQVKAILERYNAAEIAAAEIGVAREVAGLRKPRKLEHQRKSAQKQQNNYKRMFPFHVSSISGGAARRADSYFNLRPAPRLPRTALYMRLL